jgi:hypothetical protein
MNKKHICLPALLMSLLVLALTSNLFAGPDTTPTTAPAIDDATKASLAKYGKQMADAATAYDNAKLVDLMYPKVVEKAGGRDAIIQAMDAGQKEMQAHGIRVKSTTLGDAQQVITNGKKMYAILPETIVVNVPGGIKTAKGCLVGVFEDASKTWSFVDAQAGDATIRGFVPELPKDLKIPDREKPVFTPDPAK